MNYTIRSIIPHVHFVRRQIHIYSHAFLPLQTLSSLISSVTLLWLSLLPQGICQALSKLSTCPLRHPACIAALPLTSWEQRTATSICPSTAVRAPLFVLFTSYIYMILFLMIKNCYIFLCSSRQFLGHAAGCAADLVHELGVAGSAGAPAVAPSHGTEEEVERGEGREGGVLQWDTVYCVSDEALFCLISQNHSQE